MTEEKSSKAESVAKSVEKIADSKGLEALGKGIGAGIIALAMALAIAVLYFGVTTGSKWDGHLHPQTKCFELQEVAGKTFKVNTCTGEAIEFKTETETETDKVKK